MLNSRKEYDAAEQAYLLAHKLQPEAKEILMPLGNLAVIRKRFGEARYYFEMIEAMGESASH